MLAAGLEVVNLQAQARLAAIDAAGVQKYRPAYLGVPFAGLCSGPEAAMSDNKRVVDIAQAVITAAGLLR